MSGHKLLHEPTLFGVNCDPWYYSLANNTAVFDRIRGAGLNLIRINIRWDELEPTTKGTYASGFWDTCDAIFALADARGLEMILIFKYTPAWARVGGTNQDPPTTRQDYADAFGVLAAHYAARPNMRYEIWNEPNYAGYWAGTVNAAEYTDMLQKAYTAGKAADPDCSIIAGVLNHNDPTFIAAMYAAGAHGYFDAFSFHPYCVDYTATYIQAIPNVEYNFIPQMEHLRANLLARGDDVPIWMTEFNWNIDPGEYAPVTEEFRAANLALMPDLIRARPYIVGATVFTMLTDQRAGYGLTTLAGEVTSSWTAYVNAVPRA